MSGSVRTASAKQSFAQEIDQCGAHDPSVAPGAIGVNPYAIHLTCRGGAARRATVSAMKATTTSAIRALECPEEAAAAAAASPAAVRWRRARRALTVTAVLGLVAGGAAALVMWPQPRTAVPPAPGPGARALSAVETGTPAASADLTALIAERVRHLRAHPRDDESWAVLGAAYAERGRAPGTPPTSPGPSGRWSRRSRPGPRATRGP